MLGDHVYALRTNQRIVESLFLTYVINSYNINNQIRKKATGSAQIGINKKTVEEKKIKIPKELTEQQAIANILFDMDSEITALKERRDKLMDIKQGMMQQLLTGRIRLVEASA